MPYITVVTGYTEQSRVDPEGYPREHMMRKMWSRVDLEGTREINTRRGRAFLALATSPRDGATGPHYREH